MATAAPAETLAPATSGPEGAPREIVALTALRGLAAWWVVLYHIRSALESHFGRLPLIEHGYLGVDLFFVLSGFVLHLNYAGRVALTRQSWAAFAWRRIARIYPLHLVMLLGFAAMAGAILVATGRPPPAGDIGYFGLSLALVQNWGFTDSLALNVPAWSISTELAAYLLFPLWVVLARPARWPTAALIVALPVLSVALVAFFAAQGLGLGDGIARFGLVRCLVEFAMGTLVAALYVRARGNDARVIAAALALAAGLIAWRVVDAGAPVVPLTCATLILGIALWRARNPLAVAPLIWLGQVSYSTYLVHYLAFIVFKLAFVREGVATPLALIAAFLIALAAASWGLFHLVEKPGQRLMGRWWPGR